MASVGDRRVWRALFAMAVVGQLVALYWPDPPSGGGIPGLDKVVHLALFCAPALLGVLAGLRSAPLGLVLVVHAVVSELVQHVVLPGRGGDPGDALADVVGVALGLALGTAVHRAAARRRVAADRATEAPGADIEPVGASSTAD